MKYNIVITDNETGEVLKDANADAIVAVIHTKESTDVLSAACCDGLAFAETTAGLMDTLEEFKNDYPEIYKRAKKVRKITKKENTENE